jgi:plasmid rolling circle replication initiator protein Rep
VRINDEVDAKLFARKQLELNDREATLEHRMEARDRKHHEQADLAVEVFELPQTLMEKWLSADYTEKRRLLEHPTTYLQKPSKRTASKNRMCAMRPANNVLLRWSRNQEASRVLVTCHELAAEAANLTK